MSKAAYKRAARVYTPALLAKTSAPARDTIMATKIKFDIIEKLLGTQTTSCSFCHTVSPGLRKYGAEGSVYRKKMEPSAIAKNLKHDIKIEGKALLLLLVFLFLCCCLARTDNVFKQAEFGHETLSRDELAARNMWPRAAVDQSTRAGGASGARVEAKPVPLRIGVESHLQRASGESTIIARHVFHASTAGASQSLSASYAGQRVG